MQAELIILGGGPAGLTAGLYAARARVSALLIEKAITGGQMNSTELVDNYPGFPEPVYGYELSQKMEAQARRFGLELTASEITKVADTPDGFELTSESGEVYSCRALIVATGASPVKMGIPGEQELVGRGVSYCAVCDGPFYRDLEVAVVGGGDSAVEEAVYMTRFASKVHLIHRRDQLRAVRKIQEKAFAEPKITIHWSKTPVEITGTGQVTGVKLRSVKDSTEEMLPVAGIFFYVGLKPNTDVVAHLVDSDQAGFIITDEKMACSRPGIFAAGDVRAKMLRQISTAVGDGAVAAYCAQHYLENLPRI